MITFKYKHNNLSRMKTTEHTNNKYFLEFYKLKLSLTERIVKEEEIIERGTKESSGLTREDDRLLKKYEMITNEGTHIIESSKLEEVILKFYKPETESDVPPIIF